MYGVGLVCLTYNQLYRQYLETCNPVDWHLVAAHRQNCPTCRKETERLTEQARQAEIVDFDLEENK